jgi:hypothetical protein
MSDAMPDPRLDTSRPADFAPDADGQCRGIGPSVPPDGTRGRGRGAWPNTPADAPVARAAEREADAHAVRSAMRNVAMQAVAHAAAERAATESWPVATGDAAPATQPSADLVGLPDRLRTAIARYVAGRRLAGAPIERVLPEVKAFVRETVAYEGWHDPAEALMQQVVGWTIAAFYDGPAPLQASQECQEAPHAAGRR